jgi:lathosterol oxidase
MTTARPHLSLRTTQPRRFGQGWISGVFSVLFGFIGLAAVLCFLFPSRLTHPELRALYPLPYVRLALHVVLATAFVLGVISVCLRYNKALGLAGITFTLTAALLGGSQVTLDGERTGGPFLGLDWLVLNLIGFSAVYVPLERLFPHRPEQPIFRRGWRMDLAYFFVSALLVQVTTLLALKPATILFGWARRPEIATRVGPLPLVLQLPAILVLADLTQYWVHRAFHRVPWLWRVHRVHHSAEAMDWLAGSRLHLLDAAATRALAYVPIYVLGFDERAVLAYVVWVVAQATFIHANVRWELRPLRALLATPAFHHWHHAAEPEAVDRNFAVHLPVLDRLFGTYYLPDRWPNAYGLAAVTASGPSIPSSSAPRDRGAPAPRP